MARSRAVIAITENRLPGMDQRLGEHVASVINRSMDAWARAADPITPRDTGQMAANTAIEAATPASMEGEFGYLEEYAAYVHEGTIVLSPRPWAHHAAVIVMPSFVADMRAWKG